MSDITLTASIRSNLLSLQNASKLLDLTSERLSTGKKVNSALDNPSSFFAARGLTNRAGDLTSRKDGLGQAISLLQQTDKSIASLTSLVEQAKATAQSAEEASTSGVTSVKSTAASFLSATATGVTQIVSEALNATPTSTPNDVGNEDPHQITTIGDAGVVATGATTLQALGNNHADFDAATDEIGLYVTNLAGDGGSFVLNATDTVQEFLDLANGLKGVINASLVGGNIQIEFAGDSIVAFNAAGTNANNVVANALDIRGGETWGHGLVQRIGRAGDSSDNALGAFGMTSLDVLSVSVTNGGVTNSSDITITTQSVDQLISEISAVDPNISVALNATTGKFTISGTNGTDITLTNTTGTPIADLGLTLSTGTTAAASATTYTFDDGAVNSSSRTAVTVTDLLVNVFKGSTATDTFQFAVDGGGTGDVFTVSATSSIQDVLDNINTSDSGLTAVFNTTTSKIEIAAAEGTKIKLDAQTGTATFAALAFTDGTTALVDNTLVTYGAAGSAAEVAALNTDFQSILEQIDLLLSDATYKGTNLLKGGNSYVVKFNATGASSLTITGLNLGVSNNTNFNFTKDASGYDFTSAGDITQALTDTAAAITQLRSISATFGANLGVIQTREDFTTELVNVLETGAGKLVNANLEEESANMLALQTRQALGIQALSIANQSSQSILSLFR